MQFRHQFPMLRLLFPLVVGICTAIFLEASRLILIPALAAIILVLTVWVIRFPRNPNYRTRWIFGFLVSSFLFLLGFNMLVLKREILSASHFSHFQPDELLAIVDDVPREKERSWKLVIKIIAIKKGNKFIPAKGLLLTYLAKDSVFRIPGYNDLLLIHGKPVPVPPPANPGTFNYKKYLEHNSIYQQVYLKQKDWKLIRQANVSSIKSWSFRIRAYSIKVLERNHLDGKEFAIAAALLLGQDENLDYETRHEYSSAGVVHILGISGLHVGILYIVLNFILGFLDKYRKGRFLKLVLVLMMIWFYAMITGLSPAALRSATMFTFVALGNQGKRNVHIINSLATSAMVLLIFDPYLITNIGFQFSYIAVAGIVLFHEPVYKKWESRFWLPDQAWSLTVMSLAAQLVTFPLTLYYFHQFPVYFLPANLVVIPVSNIVIYIGMAVLGTSFIPFVSNILGIGTYYLIKFLNVTVRFIESLPNSVIPDIRLDVAGMCLLYLIIISSAVFVYSRKKHFLLFSLSSILILVGWNSNHLIQYQGQDKLIVYSVNKHSAIGFIKGRECLLLADQPFLMDQKLVDFNFSGSKASFGIKRTQVSRVDQVCKGRTFSNCYYMISRDSMLFIQSGNVKMVVISKPIKVHNQGRRMPVDYMLVRNNPKVKVLELLKLFEPAVIILDGSNPLSKCNRWMEECKSLGVSGYNVRNDGAWVRDL